MSRIQDVIAATPWAMTEVYVQAMMEIAAREPGQAIEALRAKADRPMGESRKVVVRDGTAVIPVVGPLMRRANMFTDISGATSLDALAREFGAAVADQSITRIVLEIDSPGGEVNGVSEFAAMVRDANAIKPVVAYVGGLGASGGYWIAAAAGKVYVSQTAMLGSIGVVMTTRGGTDPTSIQIVSSQSPHKRIDAGTESGRARLQTNVDRIATEFIAAVAGYRGTTPARVLADFGQGDVLLGADAVAAGMADGVTTLERLLNEAPVGATNAPRRLAAAIPERKAATMSGTAPEAVIASESPVIATADALSTAYPALVAAIRADAMSAGATAERTRILDIEALGIPGHEGLIASYKADGKTSPAEAAIGIIKAEKAGGNVTLAALRADRTKGADSAVVAQSTVNDTAVAVVDPDEPLEARCTREWNASAALRREFGNDPKRYIAYETAVADGRVRRMGTPAA